jgi:hypothetical protein
MLEGSTSILVNFIDLTVTFTVSILVISTSVWDTVIIAEPSDIPVTVPLLLTVA